MTKYDEILENKALNSFYNSYFYTKFKTNCEFPRVELIFYPNCNLDCAYCYMKKYENTWFYDKPEDDVLLNNLQTVLNWYSDNNFKCDIALFSGELLCEPFGLKIIDRIIEHFRRDKRTKPNSIVVPSNMTFLLRQDYIDKFEEYYDIFENELEEFDKQFPTKIKEKREGQLV